MTAIETWVTTLAAELAKDDAAAERQYTTTLEQRLAIGLIQARALECRHHAGQLRLESTNPMLPMLQQTALLTVANRLLDRSHKLEQISLGMIEKYPPDTPVPEKKLVTLTGE